MRDQAGKEEHGHCKRSRCGKAGHERRAQLAESAPDREVDEQAYQRQ